MDLYNHGHPVVLSAGTRIGPYDVTAQIGVGGMGEVYRATDTKLKRQVAIKILPPAVATDHDRLARFQREAEVLAALNHPNIAAIHGLEESDGVKALVMELVEGPTLADRIARGPMPVDEVLPIAKQIAEALEAAHDQGIIHRDLKPANIKVRADGTVKVLDFGLAKALDSHGASTSADVSQLPTITSPAMTQIGLILGTAAYMSPEQAKGRPVDRRSDIWAFGCVLYEMLTGQRAFSGDDVTETIAAVVRADPDWTALPSTLSPTLLKYLQRCLKKAPKERVHDVGDMRLAIEGAFDTASTGTRVPGIRAWQRPPVIAAGIAFAAVLGGVGASILLRPSTPSPISRFEYELADGQEFRNVGRRVIAVSPDGRQFVYNASGGLYLRRIDEFAARMIPGTEAGLAAPTFSPDGESLVYQQAGQLLKMPVSGGRPVALGALAGVNALSWGADGTILAADDSGIWRFSPQGETPVRIVEAPPGTRLSHPQLLPGAEWMLMTVASPAGDSDVAVLSLRSGERRAVLAGAFDARYLTTGHLMYQRPEGGLFAVRFDLDRLQPAGEHVTVLPALGRASATNDGNYGVSDNGTLVYLLPNGVGGERRLVWRGKRGETLGDAGVSESGLVHPELSPDEKSVAYAAANSAQGNIQLRVWNYIFANGAKVPISQAGGFYRAIWSPDGKYLAFNQTGGGDIFTRSSDGTGAAESYVAPGTKNVGDWSRDGRYLVFDWNGGAQNVGTAWDLFYLQRRSDGLAWEPEAKQLLREPQSQYVPKLSPNGRYVAYISTQSGRGEVYVRSFPHGTRQWLVSNNGGTRHRWSRDGTQLFYVEGGLAGDVMMAVDVSTASEFSYGRPRRLFQQAGFAIGLTDIATYDVAKDGRFLMVEALGREARRRSIYVVQGWFEELKRLVPTK